MKESQKKHKKEHYYKKAKLENYRARAAYKLLDIQKRFNIFKRAFYILDIGSAPGSWLQVSKNFAEENLNKYNDAYYYRNHYKIMGIDVKNITPIEGVVFLKKDINEPSIESEIFSYFQDKLDLLLSDASIKKSGNQFSDCLRQIHLCERIEHLALNLLKEKGVLIMKLFQGEDFKKFHDHLKKKFRSVKSFKPPSSKKESNEIYLICKK
ncbi:MAG: SAM-dependent methyltransferase [Promethearchaeota archaeon]